MEKRINKPVSGFGSKNLRKPWYLDLFPDSLHPFLTGLFRKDSNEWSRKENEQFEQAVSMAKKLKGVEKSYTEFLKQQWELRTGPLFALIWHVACPQWFKALRSMVVGGPSSIKYFLPIGP